MPVDWLIPLLFLVAIASIVAVVYGLSRRHRRALIAACGALAVSAIVFVLVYQVPAWRLKSAARSGDLQSQYELGLWYIYRFGYEWPNHRESAVWLQTAANRGHPEAMSRLGLLYEYGCQEAGIPIDKEKARKLYEDAAALGVSEAWEMLEALKEH